MNQIALKLARNASTAIILPIVGLLGGLLAGAIRASGRGPDEIAKLGCVLWWSINGFFLGLFLIVFLALNPRGKSIVTVRGLMGMVVVAGLLSWYLTQVLFGVIGLEGF